MNHILVPIFVCVVLPVSIVLIVALTKMNGDNKRAQILLKAIETNNDIDADKLAESMQASKKRRTPLEILNMRLLRGSIFTLVGLAAGIYGAYLDSCHTYADLVNICFMVCAASLAVGLGYLIVFFATRKQVGNNDGENSGK